MWKKIKDFYNEYDDIVQLIIIIFTVVVMIAIFAIVDCRNYKKKYEELSLDYSEIEDSYNSCIIREQLIKTDMQHYVEYYIQHSSEDGQ